MQHTNNAINLNKMYRFMTEKTAFAYWVRTIEDELVAASLPENESAVHLRDPLVLYRKWTDAI